MGDLCARNETMSRFLCYRIRLPREGTIVCTRCIVISNLGAELARRRQRVGEWRSGGGSTVSSVFQREICRGQGIERHGLASGVRADPFAATTICLVHRSVQVEAHGQCGGGCHVADGQFLAWIARIGRRTRLSEAVGLVNRGCSSADRGNALLNLLNLKVGGRKRLLQLLDTLVRRFLETCGDVDISNFAPQGLHQFGQGQIALLWQKRRRTGLKFNWSKQTQLLMLIQEEANKIS